MKLIGYLTNKDWDGETELPATLRGCNNMTLLIYILHSRGAINAKD